MCKLFLLFAAVYFRVKAFIQYGWADSVVDPDDVSTTSDEGYGAPETDDWMDIKEFYKSPDDVPRFTNVQIVSSEVRQKIEEATHLQVQCNLWYEVRQKRVTGYKCGQILG